MSECKHMFMQANKHGYVYIDEYFSFCLKTFKVELGSVFSNYRKYFWVRQAFASIQHDFLRSAENADLHSLIDAAGESVVFLFAKNSNLFFNEFWLVQWFNMGHCNIGRCYAHVWQMVSH